MNFISAPKERAVTILVIIVIGVLLFAILIHREKQLPYPINLTEVKDEWFTKENPEAFTPSEVAQNLSELLGKRIQVEGLVNVKKSNFQTLMGCSAKNPCCNDRYDEPVLIDKGVSLTLRGNEYSKSDLNMPLEKRITSDFQGTRVRCWSDACQPLCYPLLQGKFYRVTGKIGGVIDETRSSVDEGKISPIFGTQKAYWLEIESFMELKK